MTDFPHVRQMFTDAYARLVAMKLFALRASDYMRVASPDDRRYLLYNPMVKMKVTTQGEEVINLLWDVIAAKGFERDMYFEMAARRHPRAAEARRHGARQHGARSSSSWRTTSSNPREYPEVPTVDEPRNDDFLFDQGPAEGLGKIQFHDYNRPTALYDCPTSRSSGSRSGAEEAAGDGHARRGAAAGHRFPPGRSASCSRWWSTAS